MNLILTHEREQSYICSTNDRSELRSISQVYAPKIRGNRLFLERKSPDILRKHWKQLFEGDISIFFFPTCYPQKCT